MKRIVKVTDLTEDKYFDYRQLTYRVQCTAIATTHTIRITAIAPATPPMMATKKKMEVHCQTKPVNEM